MICNRWTEYELGQCSINCAADLALGLRRVTQNERRACRTDRMADASVFVLSVACAELPSSAVEPDMRVWSFGGGIHGKLDASASSFCMSLSRAGQRSNMSFMASSESSWRSCAGSANEPATTLAASLLQADGPPAANYKEDEQVIPRYAGS